MLKKLFKYDWKAFWKVPTAINLFLVVTTIIGIISLVSPFWTLEFAFMDTLLFMAITFYYLTIFACSIGVSVYTAVRYYKNVYTDEGYLTNTLPVTARQIILSKLFVGAIWSFITTIVLTVSILTLVFVALSSYGDINVFEEISRGWADFTMVLETELGINMFSLIMLCIVYTVIGFFSSIIMMYSAIALGQLFTRHKVAGAVIWYIAEYSIMQLGASLLLGVPMSFSIMSTGGDPSSIISTVGMLMWGSVILILVITVMLYFITEHILKKKLNID